VTQTLHVNVQNEMLKQVLILDSHETSNVFIVWPSKVHSWQYLQKVIIAIKVDEDAHIHSQDRQQYAGQGNRSELVDKLYTNKHDETHYH